MLERLNGEFPIRAFPAGLQEFITTAERTLNFPRAYTAGSMLLAVAVAIGNTRVLKMKEGWLVKPILFLALVGEAGANKSHPASFVLRPLKRINSENIAAYNEALADYRRRLAAGETTPQDKPSARQLIVSDITSESLITVHRNNPRRLCLHCDELAGWVGNFNRYRKGGDEQMWLSIYSGEPLCVNRKTVDEVLAIDDPFICVIGSIQPDILASTFSGERQSNGFLYRILQARADGDTKLLWNDEGFPPKLEKEWDGLLRRILEKSDKDYAVFDTPAEYRFADQASIYVRMWQNDWEETLEQEGRPGWVEAFRKIQDYALKFALILHTMREAAEERDAGTEIAYETAVWAAMIAEYFFFTVLQSLDAIEERNPPKYPRSHGDFIMALPAEFGTGEAVSVGARFGLSERTVKRILRDGKGIFFIWLSHGRYAKK